MRNKILLAALCGCLLLPVCSPNIADGGSTETTNRRVIGTLYQPDGKTPAAGVKVAIRPNKSLADTAGIALAKAVLVDTATVVTDSAGRFAFDSTLDTGTYVIEAASGNDAVLIDSVAVTSKDSTDTLAPDTLRPAGALKGVIKLTEGGDPRKVFILAFGIDRFARVNADGSFKFTALAEAKYDLRLISSLDNYGVLDTSGISVRSADTTDLDTIELPFTGIPTPKNVKIAYDTLRQIVTLTWAKADTALAKTYNVYRRNVGLNTVLARINTSPVADTVYRDSTGVQDSTYEYAVAAVSSANMEGTKSAVVSVTVVSAFQFVKNFGTVGTGTGQLLAPADIALDGKGRYWLADGNRNKIMCFDNTGTFLTEWGVQGDSSGQLYNPYGLDIDSHQNIIVCEWDGARVERFDTLGNLTLEIDSVGIKIHDVSVDEQRNIYFSMITSGGLIYICKYDSTGKLLKSWQPQSKILHYALLARNGKVYSAGTILSSTQNPNDREVIEVFDTAGTAIQIINIRQPNETGVIQIRDIDIDASGNLYAVDPDNNKVRIFDANLNYVTSFGKKGTETDAFSSIQGIAISYSKTIAITDLGTIHLFKQP
jgi:hypothetical protein